MKKHTISIITTNCKQSRDWFGLPLKGYCSIPVAASLQDIKQIWYPTRHQEHLEKKTENNVLLDAKTLPRHEKLYAWLEFFCFPYVCLQFVAAYEHEPESPDWRMTLKTIQNSIYKTGTYLNVLALRHISDVSGLETAGALTLCPVSCVRVALLHSTLLNHSHLWHDWTWNRTQKHKSKVQNKNKY